MTAVERRNRIAERVRGGQDVRVADLVREFGVTETSIRRDLSVLEAGGKLLRVHGGAVPAAAAGHEQAYHEKMGRRIDQKRRIGAAAARLIEHGDVLVFDAGTTTLQAALHVPEAMRSGNMLTIATNSIPLALHVQDWPSPSLVLLGGMFLPDQQATVGPVTITQLREFRADKFFLGADGIDLRLGVMTAHLLMAEVNRTMAEQARKVILAVDSSKFGRTGFVPIIPVHRVDLLITDDEAPPETVEEIRQAGVEVWLV